MAELTFENRVVVVTGAGNGSGRAYAHEFARRGARVVVNDLGGSVDGVGADRRSADAVVAEITGANGEAVASYDSVEDGARIIETAMDTWGRVDVVLNNAGIAYRTEFSEMTRERWETMMNVHGGGSYACSYAAWPHMVKQGYGRLLYTSSPFGLYACPGFAHYSAAKAGLIGLTKALALEGAERGIRAHAGAPYSASRMPGFTNEQQAASEIGPRYLAQLAVWLSHEATQETGSVFEVGGGYIHKVHLELSPGLHLPDDEHTAENIAAGRARFDDLEGSLHPPLGDYNTIGRAVFGPDLEGFRN